jgi:hypothetical protein
LGADSGTTTVQALHKLAGTGVPLRTYHYTKAPEKPCGFAALGDETLMLSVAALCEGDILSIAQRTERTSES